LQGGLAQRFSPPFQDSQRNLTSERKRRGTSNEQDEILAAAAGITEIKMRKTLVTILCSALIAASSIQAAAAAEHHHARKAGRKPVMVDYQHRNSSNEQPRDSNVGGMCGIFPGPCQ
jgi:hypothetical protein